MNRYFIKSQLDEGWGYEGGQQHIDAHRRHAHAKNDRYDGRNSQQQENH